MKQKPLDQELFDEPYMFDFFQAVRLLERMYPASKTVGGGALPHEENIRFRSRVTLEYPASEVHEIRNRKGGDEELPEHEMLVNFMGMVGVSGVMPRSYSDLVAERARYRDTAIWEFMDIFTHRSVSLFYRAWAKYRFPVNFERGNDDFTAFMYDIAGLGTRGLRRRMDVEDESLLPYTGLVAQKPHSASALINVIEDYYGISARVEQLCGQWLNLSQDDITVLGKRNSTLGSNVIAGRRVWDQQSKFRLILGPLSLQKFIAFLPNADGYKALKSIVKFMAGFEFDYDVKLRLAKEQIPGTVLTTRAKRRPMLGWTSFLKTRPAPQDDEQLVLGIGA